MTDEKFLFVSDVADKRRTARGSHNKKTYCGKGVNIKFPSDYLSRKELKAMNGDVKSYQMNKPITWAEFKAMPDDIKITYIKSLRNKFNVPDFEIFEMMGINRKTGTSAIAEIGLSKGRGSGSRTYWNKENWQKWLAGASMQDTDDSDQIAQPIEQPLSMDNCEQPAEPVKCDGTNVDYIGEISRLSERIKDLEIDNAILAAKLSMVYLFFGKEQELQIKR